MTRPTVHRQDHPLAQAHSPTPAQGGTVVYCVCGYAGCRQRLVLARAQWQAELRRRQQADVRQQTFQAWDAAWAPRLEAAQARQRAIDARWAGRREEEDRA
jgi:hypothetical protein